MFDPFSKGFACHVEVFEQFAARCSPAYQSILKQAYIAIAHALKNLCRTQGNTFTCVKQHDHCVLTRYANGTVGLDAPQRQVNGKQGMTLPVSMLFTHINQCDFLFLH